MHRLRHDGVVRRDYELAVELDAGQSLDRRAGRDDQIPCLDHLAVRLDRVPVAQAALTGTVKDASGAVLPGVTVEASSPALIEKTKSAVTDGSGQYRIIDLRPGTYSLSFSHHTAIVSAVDKDAKVVKIYHQNMGGKKFVQEGSLTLGHLTAGWIRVYRPEPKK